MADVDRPVMQASQQENRSSCLAFGVNAKGILLWPTLEMLFEKKKYIYKKLIIFTNEKFGQQFQ